MKTQWKNGQKARIMNPFIQAFVSIDNRKKTKKTARQAYILNTILIAVAITKNNF